jgi:hypothetical protein
MQYEETLYEILVNTNLNDLQSLCHSDKKIRQLCHNKYFIDYKFNNLGFNIYRPIKHTFNNLLYIGHLINVAYKLINFMVNHSSIIFYNNPNDNIKDLEKVSPAIVDRILNQLENVDETNQFYGVFEGSLLFEYNHKTINGTTIPTNDQKFYLSYWIYTPNDMQEAIDLTIDDTVEYLVNIFLNDKHYALINHQYKKYFDNVKELEHFLDIQFIKLSPKRRVKQHYSYYL